MILLNILQILVEQQSLNIVWTQTRDWVFCNKIFVSDAKKNIKFQQYADFLKTDICLYLGSSCEYIQQQRKDESIPSSETGRWLSSWFNWEMSIGGNQIQQINHTVLVQGRDTYWNQREKPELRVIEIIWGKDCWIWHRSAWDPSLFSMPLHAYLHTPAWSQGFTKETMSHCSFEAWKSRTLLGLKKPHFTDFHVTDRKFKPQGWKCWRTSLCCVPLQPNEQQQLRDKLASAAIKPPSLVLQLQPNTQPQHLSSAAYSTVWNSHQPTLSEPHTKDSQSPPAGFLHPSHNHHTPAAQPLPTTWTSRAGKEN